MRGTFIFDQLNDVVFSKVDKSLEDHLIKLFVREGLVQNESSNTTGELDTNALVQLFSPLVTSQRIMLNQFNNPYTAIHAQDGTIMTFSQRLGFLFIAMGSEKEESLAIIQRRLNIFVRFVNFLCGPIFNLLKSFHPGAAERQKLLNCLLDKWEELRKEELSFQIEAVERLLVNEYLSTTGVNLLQTVLDKIRSLGRDYHYPSHAFLIVNTKLLTLYTSRKASELTASDILLLAMLAHTHHPTCRFELPRSPRHSPLPSNIHETFALPTVSGNTLQVPRLSVSSDPDEGTVHEKSPSDSSYLQVPLHAETDSSDSESFYSPSGSPPEVASVTDGVSKLTIKIPDSNFKETGHHEVDVNAHDDILEEGINWHVDPSIVDITYDYIFLNTSKCPLTPHKVHTVKIMDGVVLIIVCDTGKDLVASSVVQTLTILHDSQVFKQPELAKQHLDLLESSMKRLIDFTKKHGTNVDAGERLIRNLMNRWDVVKRNGLGEFLKSTTTRFMTSRLESAATALMEIIQEVFQVLCLPEKSTYIPLTTDQTNVLVGIQAYMRFNLADYGDYLRVKALRNVTLSSYINDFPGLVHFIYVNRTTNQVVVPVVDENLISSDSSIRKTLKSKVSRMIEFTRAQLQLGHFAIRWRDSHFSYCYFLWFEDNTGDALKPQVVLQGLRNYPPPGILCGNFFKLLRKECFPDIPADNINCFELLCVHLLKATPDNLTEYIRKLVSVVWDMTGGNAPPFNIL